MNVLKLPANYKLIRETDPAKDKKMVLWMNLTALAIATLMVTAALVLRTIGEEKSGSVNIFINLVPAALMIAGAIAYVFLHEAVHGFFIERFSKTKAKYGFTGLFAYAGSDTAYFDRRSYVVIALAPIVLLGAALLALNLALPASLFWYVYMIQILNIAGAAGDSYVVLLTSKMPRDTLINDTGKSIRFYSAQG